MKDKIISLCSQLMEVATATLEHSPAEEQAIPTRGKSLNSLLTFPAMLAPSNGSGTLKKGDSTNVGMSLSWILQVLNHAVNSIVEYCAGKCKNGGVCVNGKCVCPPKYKGDYCQIKGYSRV